MNAAMVDVCIKPETDTDTDTDTPAPSLRKLASGFWVTTDTGDAVAHSVLEHLPFAQTMEPWVRANFPHAHYEAHDTLAMHAVDLRRPGVVAIQGPKGLGKSKAIRAAIAALPEHTTAVQITFRRSLAWSSAELLGAAASVYSALPAGSISARQHPRLTIVVNSVARIRGTYDVVVIDEIVSVLDMLAGTLLAPSVRGQIVNTLQWLIACAKTVVLADAMLDAACIEFVMRCRATATSTAMPLYVTDYVRRLHVDYTYIAHANVNTWQRELTYALCRGKRVVVPCMTKTMAEHIASRFAATFSTLLYTADSHGARLSEHMSAIDAHWSTVQLLVFSPVITAGCSFERRHFDMAFFYGAAGMGSVRSAVQMIARVRDLSTKTVHVFLARADASYAPLPCQDVVFRGDESAAEAADVAALAPHKTTSQTQTHTQTHLALLRLLDASRSRETLICERAFAFYFWSLVAHSGPRITFLRADLASMATSTATRDAESTSTSSLSTSTSTMTIPAEPPFMHDWDGAYLAPFMSNDAARAALGAADGLAAAAAAAATSAAAARPTLLQRVTICAPLATLMTEHAWSLPSTLSWCRFAGASDDGAITATLPSCAPEVRARVKAWLALLVAKAIAAPSKPAASMSSLTTETLTPTGTPWSSLAVAAAMNKAATRGVTTTTHFPPVLAAPALVPRRAVQRYMSADTSAMDVVLDAWALTARREGDADVRLPHGLLPLLLQRIENAQRAVFTAHGVLHMMTNVPVGRSAGGVGTVDAVAITADHAVHLFALRQGLSRQRATADVALDLVKLQCLAHAAAMRAPYELAGLHVVYADAAVHVPAPGCAPYTPMPNAALCVSTEELLQQHAALAVVRACGDDASFQVDYYIPAAATPQSCIVPDAKHALQLLQTLVSRGPLLSWGVRALVTSGVDASASAPALSRIQDVETALAGLLNAHDPVPLEDVHCHHDIVLPRALRADVALDADADVESESASSSLLRRLWQAALAVYKYGFVVIVVEGRPVSVELRVVPPLALSAAAAFAKT